MPSDEVAVPGDGGLWIRRTSDEAAHPGRRHLGLLQNPALAVAVVAGTLAVAAALPPAVSAVISATVTADKPPDCVAVAEKYDKYLGTEPRRIAVLTDRGTDDRSPLDADEGAQRCGIDRTTLERMVVVP